MPQFVFDLCDVLIGRGEKPKCMAKLKALESNSDPDVLQRLAAYYSQIGEDKLALEAFRRALAVNPNLQKIPDFVKTLTEKVEGRDI